MITYIDNYSKNKVMMSKWLFLGSMFYKHSFPPALVSLVAVEVYTNGYKNGLEDFSRLKKKPFLRNIANMAESTCIGTAKALVFPIYIPANLLYLYYTKN